MKTASFLLLTLIFCAGAANAQTPLKNSQIPLRADAPVLFAPRGWHIEKTVNGHLNLSQDKNWDAVLVLIQNPSKNDDADNPANRARALVVLLGEGKGWHRVGFNSSLLLGTRDGGAFYGMSETPVNVAVKKGVIEVNQDNGSREVTETTFKFRFEPKQNGVFLIGSELSERDRLTTDANFQSTNYLSGIQKTTSIKGENDKITQIKSRVSRKLRTLQSVKVDERYSK